jgi:hypothetical protein
MSPLTARRLLWLAFVLVAPVPFFLVESGWMPPLALLQLAAWVLALIAREGALGQVGTMAAILIGQGVFYVILFWVLAWAISLLLLRLSRRAIACVTLGSIALGVVLASSFEIYRTPFRARSLSATLLGVYE